MPAPTSLVSIQQYLASKGTPERVAASLRYFPDKQLRVYGVAMPELNALAKTWQSHGFPLVKQLWKAGSLEEQLLAGKILERISKKDPEQALALVEQFSKAITNWAVCDCLGMQSLRGLVKTHTESIFQLAEKLNDSTDMWQRRLSLVLVEWFTRDKQFHPRIQRLIAHLENDKEYYVKKAIVWIRKNFEKGK